MGYSGRYHAASLAAVFLALAVGILIGVGFGSDLVSGTAEDLEQSLESDLDNARERVEELEGEIDMRDEVTGQLVPAVVGGRLRGREIALVALGGLDEELASNVRQALAGTGASLSEIAVVRVPPDAAAAGAVLSQAAARRAADDREVVELAGEAAGRALARGGERFDAVRSNLFSRYSGAPGDVDGVVLVRQRPGDLTGRQAELADRLEQGMLAGLRAGGPGGRELTVVGVERSDSEPSAIPFFSDRGLTSVDNLDQTPGRVSVVFALDGAEGAFGVKETADRLLPDLLVPPSFGFGAAARSG